MTISRRVLPIIVFAQFCSGSIWFASNGIMSDLIQMFDLQQRALGDLTSAVQFGFISGTLTYAALTISDRFSPSKVFFVSAILGAISNTLLVLDSNSLSSLLAFRFLTGFFLAGIYPVGMKIAADYYDHGLGKSLGYLVGALVVGTAFPHLLKEFTQSFDWIYVVYFTSGLALFGGLIILIFIPDGPFRKAGQKLDLTAFITVFRNPKFRAPAFGYFGHMWELYAFWAFVPFILEYNQSINSSTSFNIPLWSFIVIGIGGISCVIGGYLSLKYGPKRIAGIALATSGICCLISPLFVTLTPMIFIFFLIVWGMAVVADSPLFSTLVAKNAVSEIKGTALTIVNCIGFAITIFSIQLLNLLSVSFDPKYLFVVLAIGPVFGLISLYKKK